MVGTPALDIAAEAGEWPEESALRSLADAAIAAAIEVLGSEVRRPARSPLPHPPPARSGRTPASDPESSEVGNTRLRGGREISILFTNDDAVRRLNAHYRGKDRPTNVLSFPQPSGPLLGDIVLAAETVRAEAALAGKPLEAHMAHLIIHGFLHLLGYDHGGEEEAETMEAVERAALERMGIPDPYAAASEK
jgi:probable rRNA maturation factor